jgi:hypothetical protein
LWGAPAVPGRALEGVARPCLLRLVLRRRYGKEGSKGSRHVVIPAPAS